MPTTAGGGIRLHYEVHGHGPSVLLLLHGWAGSGRYFDLLLEVTAMFVTQPVEAGLAA